MRGHRFAFLGRPSWAGGPKYRQATYLWLAPQGEFMNPLGIRASACDGSVATSVGPPQAKARTPNGLCTAVNLPCRQRALLAGTGGVANYVAYKCQGLRINCGCGRSSW